MFNLILLIDANNLAFRADQTSNLTTKAGIRIGAIYGTLRMIKSYITQTSMSYRNDLMEAIWESQFVHSDNPSFSQVICAWDGGKSQFRKDIYADYKGQRERKRAAQSEEQKQQYEDFVHQMQEIDDLLPLLGVHSIKIRHYEADDVICYICKKSKNQIVIVSTDKDMLQLVNSHVAVWSPYKKELYTQNNFKKLTGLEKSSFIDYRVLVGDSSDNIKGIKGIGEKTAKQLIGQYKTLDRILDDRKHLIKKVRTARIFDQLETIQLNKQLMDMNNIPFDQGFRENLMKCYENVTDFDSYKIKKLFANYQFTSLLSNFINWSEPFKDLG